MKSSARSIAAVAMIVSAAALTGCSALNMSTDAQEQSKTVICASSDLTISQLTLSSKSVSLAATLIRDNTTDEMAKTIAQTVIDHPADESAINQLRAWVQSLCQ